VESHEVRLFIDALDFIFLIAIDVQAHGFELNNFALLHLVRSEFNFVNSHEEEFIRGILNTEFEGIFILFKYLNNLD
jgi:hypothetical protein